jgi:hypothetical protein
MDRDLRLTGIAMHFACELVDHGLWVDLRRSHRTRRGSSTLVALSQGLPRFGRWAGSFSPSRRQFATVRQRHDPIEGLPIEPYHVSHGLQTRRSRAEKLTTSDGHSQLPKLILGVKFADGSR